MTRSPQRHGRGTSVGGQFAAVLHAEAELTLGPPAAAPQRAPWTPKRIQAAAEARADAAADLARELEAAKVALAAKQRAADDEFFEWDTQFAAAGLSGRLRKKYLKDRAVIRGMLDDDPVYRYNRDYTHKPLAPLRQSAGVLINRALNKLEDVTGSDYEWSIRL